MRHDLVLSRREVLAWTSGLILTVTLPLARSKGKAVTPALDEAAKSRALDPRAYVRIGMDSSVMVVVKHIEWGQGIFTGLATVVADEMDADWSQMRAVSAPADATLYGNELFDGLQVTAGSTSMPSSYELMRRAGACARAMLVEAAAHRWKVPSGEVRVERGIISHAPSQRRGSFGDFAAAAAGLPVPRSIALKQPSSFTLIGRESAIKRLDTPVKVNGSARYGLDVQEPGMLTVVVARPNRFGAKLARFDAAAALRIRGVVAVKAVSSGVAVYANDTWTALKGRSALSVTWDESAAEKRGTDELVAEYLKLAQSPGTVVGSRGNIPAAFAGAEEVLEANYVLPYLAHAPMEPLNAYIRWDGTSADARYGCPIQTLDQGAIAQVLGLKPERVAIETLFAGGSFGRRGPPNLHFAIELAECAKAIGAGRPIKLMWTREDDLQGGQYRPLFVHRMRGALKKREILAITDTIVGQSFFSGTDIEKTFENNGIDPYMSEGSRDLIYGIENLRCDVHKTESPITTCPWRSTGYSHTIYAVECFVDSLLEKCRKDPIAGRLELLARQPHGARALQAVADLSKWTGPGPVNGRARGVALFHGYDSVWVAQIAEVSIDRHRKPKVHKVWCAIDCGLAVNPDIVRAQMESGIAWGAGHALYAEVPISGGASKVANFNGYHALTIDEMPDVEVTIIPSSAPPAGLGELGVPPAAPAIANALARLTGSRPTTLPMARTT